MYLVDDISGGGGALTLSNKIVTIQQRRNYGKLAVPNYFFPKKWIKLCSGLSGDSCQGVMT